MPYENLDDGLKLVHDNESIRQLIGFMEDNWLVDVYIEHEVNVVIESLPTLAYKGGTWSDVDKDAMASYSGDKDVACDK